jgi:hypothetical protein
LDGSVTIYSLASAGPHMTTLRVHLERTLSTERPRAPVVPYLSERGGGESGRSVADSRDHFS